MNGWTSPIATHKYKELRKEEETKLSFLVSLPLLLCGKIYSRTQTFYDVSDYQLRPRVYRDNRLRHRRSGYQTNYNRGTALFQVETSITSLSGADTGFSKRGVETRDMKRGGGGGGG